MVTLSRSSFIFSFYLLSLICLNSIPTNAATKLTCSEIFASTPPLVPTDAQIQKMYDQAFLYPQLLVAPDGQLTPRLTKQKGFSASLVNAVAELLGKKLGIPDLGVMMSSFLQDQRQDVPYFRKLWEAFGIGASFQGMQNSSTSIIPEKGPLLIVLNHAHAGIDAVPLAGWAQDLRPNVKIAMNKILEDIPGIQPHAIFMDPMGSERARAYNQKSRLQAIEHLKEGGALIYFPGGEVSGKKNLTDIYAVDRDWQVGALQYLISVPETRIQISFVSGQPSQAFHQAKKISPYLGIPMVLGEMHKKLGSIMNYRFGSTVTLSDLPLPSVKELQESSKLLPAKQYYQALHQATYDENGKLRSEATSVEVINWLQHMHALDELGILDRKGVDLAPLANYLRARTYLLSDDYFQRLVRQPQKQSLSTSQLLPLSVQTANAIPSEKTSSSQILEELNKLPFSTLTDRNPQDPTKSFKSFLFSGLQAPQALRSVIDGQRLAYATEGENCDLDAYDAIYDHLLVWDKEQGGQYAGSYRLGPIHKIMKSHGLQGIYSHALFDLSRMNFSDLTRKKLAYGLDVGRSATLPEYRPSGERAKKAALVFGTLWQGIGQYLIQHPELEYLFGPVSISVQRYKPLSIVLLMEYLRRYEWAEDALIEDPEHPGHMIDLIQSRQEPHFQVALSSKDIQLLLDHHNTFAKLEVLIRDIEGDASAKLPPLFEIYKKRGMKFYSFYYDQEFGTIDAFGMTHLREQPFDLLKGYMGDQGAKFYLNYRNP